ncbi:hypothetical protein ACJMK2_030141 [Sinanodonta woodiana]|uniref:F-actin monooxygenase n=1 Tax=Sinanodonta woodiana TaxID=1069815 RepID=A0ABD3XG54_SINWO
MEVDGVTDPTSELFNNFVNSNTCKNILSSFNALCEAVGLKHADHRYFYRRLKSRINSWQAQSLWVKLDKRASHKEYRKQESCANTRVLIIGGGPCGLRTAIEVALLGGKAVVLEKRDRFSRNNVLHLWPFLITDLRNLGAKKFFGKFCAGAIDHISIRQLQCILLKVALILGVEVHVNVSFIDLVQPTGDHSKHGYGWRCVTDPEDHVVSEYEFDVLIGADGKRNTLEGFSRKEFRGKLAIAITANFINRNTQQEARVEEISGVAFIFNQKFFKDLYEKTGIDLENIVYYKDETHYFVMTAKKTSLQDKGVLKKDYADTSKLLSMENVDQEALLAYAREAADFSTDHQLPHLEYAVNHYGQADVSMFDFTSIFHAENASRVVERNGFKLVMCLVGDSLCEPFWPTGSGCARGFLGALDAAWMIKRWASGKMTTLEVIAERENIFQLLTQTTPENLHKNHSQYTIDPSTRYPNVNFKCMKPEQVRHLYDTGDNSYKDEIVELPVKRLKNEFVDTYSLLCWCQKILNTGKYHTIHITDLTTSWRNGLAFCALVHYFKPDLIDYNSLNEDDAAKNCQLAFDIAQRELGINPVMKGEDLTICDKPDKLTIVSYLSQFYEHFRKEQLNNGLDQPSFNKSSMKLEESLHRHRLPSHKLSLLQKLKTRASLSKLRKKKEIDERDYNKKSIYHVSKSNREEMNGDVQLTRFCKLPMEEIANRLYTGKIKTDDVKTQKEEIQSNVKVSAMAEILVSKLKGNFEQQPLPPPERKMKGQPTLLAAQPASEFCFFCKKRVYIMERMTAEGVFFHRQCLRCDFCECTLNLSSYSVDRNSYGDAIRFFCFRHARAESRVGRSKRKRSPGARNDVVSKENIPVDSADEAGLTPPKMCTPNTRSPKKGTPAPLLPKSLAVPVDLTGSLKTPERIEFENTINGLPEESEEEQTEYNLRSSVSMDSMFMEEEGDTDSDLESDEELKEAVDLFNEGHLEESICLMKESLRRSQDNLMDFHKHVKDNGYEEMTNGEPEEEDTENDESEYETDEDEDTDIGESEPTNSKTELNSSSRSDKKNSLEIISGSTVISPVSPGSLNSARAKFFTSPAEVVRLDPWKMFAMDKSKEEEGKKENTESWNDSDGDGTEGTDNQVEPHILDEAKELKASDKDVNTEEEIDEVFVSANYDSISDEEAMEKNAVSQAMEVLLAQMDKRPSVRSSVGSVNDAFQNGSDSNYEGNVDSLDEIGDDEVFRENRRIYSSRSSHSQSGSEYGSGKHSKGSRSGNEGKGDKLKLRSSDKSFLGSKSNDEYSKDSMKSQSSSDRDTEKLVLQSVQRMSDNTTSGSGETTLHVLESVEALKDSEEKDIKQSIQCLDDRFVTKRPRRNACRKKLKSSQQKYVESDSSFTISTPSRSTLNSSASSLSSELENDEVQFADDVEQEEKPDEDMMKDYFLTVSQALGEEEEMEHSEHDDIANVIISQANVDLDETLLAENEMDLQSENLHADVSSPGLSSHYETPNTSFGEPSFLSARSEQSIETETSKHYLMSPSGVRPLLEENKPKMNSDSVESVHKRDHWRSTSSEPGADKSTNEDRVRNIKGADTSATTLAHDQRTKVRLNRLSSGKSDLFIERTGRLISGSSDTVSMECKDRLNSAEKDIVTAEKMDVAGIVDGEPAVKGRTDHFNSDKDTVSTERASPLNSGNLERTSHTTFSSVLKKSDWRPLPPVPKVSAFSPQMSKKSKVGVGRKLPEISNLKSKNSVAFQSKFMKQNYVSPSNSVEKKEDELEEDIMQTSVVDSQPRPLPTSLVECKDEPIKGLHARPLDVAGKTRVSVDYKSIKSFSDSSGEETQLKKIPVDASVIKSVKENSVDDNNYDFPFADDTEEEKRLEEKNCTSSKNRPQSICTEKLQKDSRKRILPTPPSDNPLLLDAEQIREIKRIEMDTARERARQKARLKSNEDLGLQNMDYASESARKLDIHRQLTRKKSTGTSSHSISSHNNTPSDHVTDSDDGHKPCPFLTSTPDIVLSSTSPKQSNEKNEKRDCEELNLSAKSGPLDHGSKTAKKKRSLLANLLSGLTPEKGKSIKEKDRSSSCDMLDEKKAKKKKSPKSSKAEKKEKKKKKRISGTDSLDLSDNFKEMKIGSVFTESRPSRWPGKAVPLPPKASVDDFCDLEESTSDTMTRRIKSDYGPLSDEEFDAKIARKIQHAAKKQQKQQEQKRLRQAQEIQRKLQELDVRQRELEVRGVLVEKALRGEGPEASRPEKELMQEWFNLVHEKNALVRQESDLVIRSKELELEDRQGRLQQKLREMMAIDGLYDLDDDVFEEPHLEPKSIQSWIDRAAKGQRKSMEQKMEEDRVYKEYLQVVEERDKIVTLLEEERLREQEEDRDLKAVMHSKGFTLSPVSSSRNIRFT